MPRGQYFRASAGLVIINRAGLVLALERARIAGAWQLPQGGLEKGEEPQQAALREATEETGIRPDDLVLVDTYPEPLAYELPEEFRSEKTGRGQTGYWFLFRFVGDEKSIDVAGGGEFDRWTWMPLSDLAAQAASFRRPIYRKLAEQFRQHLK